MKTCLYTLVFFLALSTIFCSIVHANQETPVDVAFAADQKVCQSNQSVPVEQPIQAKFEDSKSQVPSEKNFRARNYGKRFSSSVDDSVSKNNNFHRPKMYGRIVGRVLFAVSAASLVYIIRVFTFCFFGLVCPVSTPATQIFAVSAVVGSLSLLIGALPLVLCNAGLNYLDEE